MMFIDSSACFVEQEKKCRWSKRRVNATNERGQTQMKSASKYVLVCAGGFLKVTEVPG